MEKPEKSVGQAMALLACRQHQVGTHRPVGPVWGLGQFPGTDITEHQGLGIVDPLKVQESDGTQFAHGLAEFVVLDDRVGNLKRISIFFNCFPPVC